MGRGTSWLVVENMALIKAWLTEANNPIRGTDQSSKEFWTRVLKSWQHVLRNETDASVKAALDQRGFEALRKQWAKLVAGVMEFSSCIVQARPAKPTGISTHADLVYCAEGLYCGTNVYGRIRGDHADDMAKGKTTKRRTKQVSFPWAQYWEQLKDQDRFKSAAAALAALQKKSASAQARAAARAAAAAASGDGGPAAEQAAAGVDPAPAAAANAAVANAAAAGSAVGDTAPTDTVDSDDEEQGPWAGRPIGCKAAKRARADNITDDRTIGRVASAVEKLGDASTQRTAMMAFSLPFMRTTPEGAAFWAHQAKKMLATEGIKVKAPKPASDSSAAADGEANKTSKDMVVAPPPFGNVDDLSAIDDSSATGNAAAEEDVTVVGDTRSIVPPPVATPEVVEEMGDAERARTSAAPTPAAPTTATATAANASVSTPAAASSTPTSNAAPALTMPSSSPARSAANKRRGRRAQATKSQQAAASMSALVQTTVDLTAPPPAPPAAPAPPSSLAVAAAAAAAPAAAAAAPAVTPTDARRTPQSVSRQRPPPQSGSASDSVSDGGGFDGFDSDLIAAFERKGGRSSSESDEDE